VKIIGYYDHGKRSQHIVDAAMEGAAKFGYDIQTRQAENFNGEVEGDIAIFYGLRGNLNSIFKIYNRAGKKCVFIDLGFFGRNDGGKLEGYHRISLNEYFPYLTMQKFVGCEEDRLNVFDLKIDSVRGFANSDGHILLAGMSKKSAVVNGFAANEYELAVIDQIKSVTNRAIVYRPKPSWAGATPLPGTTYSPPGQSLEEVLHKTYAVVTHHSNVAIDGLIKAIPCVVSARCPPQLMGTDTARNINRVMLPSVSARKEWLSRLCYCQYKPDEFRSGEFFKIMQKWKVL